MSPPRISPLNNLPTSLANLSNWSLHSFVNFDGKFAVNVSTNSWNLGWNALLAMSKIERLFDVRPQVNLKNIKSLKETFQQNLAVIHSYSYCCALYKENKTQTHRNIYLSIPQYQHTITRVKYQRTCRKLGTKIINGKNYIVPYTTRLLIYFH